MIRPPPVVLITVGYGAGLATGLAHFPDLPFVGACWLVLAALLRSEWWWPVLPAVAVGLIAGGHAGQVAVHDCAAHRSLGDQQYRLRSIDPGEGTGRAAVLAPGCAGVLVARWPPAAHVPAGATMRVTARWRPVARPLGRTDGMLQISALDSMRIQPTIVEGVRTRITRSAHRLFGPRAPLVMALVAGWRGELDPELRQAFAAAGVMHLLAISGLHVACLAGWFLLLLHICRVPRHPAEMASALVALGYVAFLGWPAAATRAVSLLLLAAWCRWRQRHVRVDAVLAASALAILIENPWNIVDVGAWLSVLGVSGLVVASRWSDRAVGTMWWVRSVSGSVGAMLATAPVTALVFGQVAPVGIVLNIVATPLVILALPAVFLPLLLHSTLPVVATAIAASGNGLLAMLELVVRLGAQAPGAATASAPGVAHALPWLGMLLAAGWIVHRRTTVVEATRRFAWITVAVMWITVFATRPLVADDHRLTLLFLDVGQGDAALVRTPRGHWIEVDAGPTGDGWDAGRRVIAPVLAREGIRRIDLFVLSHAHRDHVGGGGAVLDRVPVALALEPGELFSDSAYDGWLEALAKHRVRWRAVRAGTTWTLDGVRFRVLHPPTPWPLQGADLNEDSMVLELTYGSFGALFTGDAGFVAESAMAGALRPVDVLKVGHHGSRTASSEAFLAAVRPQAAIVSVGRNRYGHPAPGTLERLAGAHIAVWRTDQEGTVRVSTDGRSFTVTGVRATVTFATRH